MVCMGCDRAVCDTVDKRPVRGDTMHDHDVIKGNVQVISIIPQEPKNVVQVQGKGLRCISLGLPGTQPGLCACRQCSSQPRKSSQLRAMPPESSSRVVRRRQAPVTHEERGRRTPPVRHMGNSLKRLAKHTYWKPKATSWTPKHGLQRRLPLQAKDGILPTVLHHLLDQEHSATC